MANFDAVIDLWIKVTWKSLDNDFQRAMDRIKRDREELEKEAMSSNVLIGFTREEQAAQRHQELLDVIPISRVSTVSLTKSSLMIPHRRDEGFHGREKELLEIHGYFTLSNEAKGRCPKVLAIQGLGGLGKTTIAREYVYRYRGDYRAIFWLRAETPAILQQDFSQISRHLQYDTHLQDITDLKARVQMAFDWLSVAGECVWDTRNWGEIKAHVALFLTVFLDDPWLLVFDNVDDVEVLHEYWPNAGSGCILLTTRDRDAADALAAKQLRLQGFSDSEGSGLFLRHVGSSNPPTETSMSIISELGGLPLALCQMGSYIRQTNCSMESFLQLLHERLDSSRLYSDTASMSSLQYTNTLASCFDISVSRLSNQGKHLLNVLACFQTDGIPESLVTDGCLVVSRLRALSDMIEWNSAIRQLTKYDLIDRSEAPDGTRILTMHRVVKRHALHRLDKALPLLRLEAFCDALDLINQVFPTRPLDGGTTCKAWDLYEKWLPHVISIKDAFDPSIRDPPRSFAEMLVNAAYYMWERGIDHATSFSANALEVIERILPPEDPDPIKADIFQVVGSLRLPVFTTRPECPEIFERSLQVRIAWLKKASPPTKHDLLQLANAYNNAGAARLVNEDFDDALRLFQKSLEIKYTMGDESTMPYDLSVSFYNICRVQLGKGLVKDALYNCERALKLAEQANGPKDFRVNQFRFTYADLLIACDNVQEGLEIHKKTLEIREEVMGYDNNDTGVSYYGLSCVHHRLSELDKAL
jgi:tetratricopeptide (TPR) repeat protein